MNQHRARTLFILGLTLLMGMCVYAQGADTSGQSKVIKSFEIILKQLSVPDGPLVLPPNYMKESTEEQRKENFEKIQEQLRVNQKKLDKLIVEIAAVGDEIIGVN